MLSKLAIGLPYSRPMEPLKTQEKKIAALLKPLGKTGLYGDANKGKANGCKRHEDGRYVKVSKC